MNYTQHIAQAMLKMGEGDSAGAELEFQYALEEAHRIDPAGPREAEVLNYLALFFEQSGQKAKAAAAKAGAQLIFKKFEET